MLTCRYLLAVESYRAYADLCFVLRVPITRLLCSDYLLLMNCAMLVAILTSTSPAEEEWGISVIDFSDRPANRDDQRLPKHFVTSQLNPRHMSVPYPAIMGNTSSRFAFALMSHVSIPPWRHCHAHRQPWICPRTPRRNHRS